MSSKVQSSRNKWLREIGEILLAFAVAWLGYQGLSLATGTPLPIVAVVSDSMYHTAEFGGWWEKQGGFYEGIGITMSRFESFPFKSGLSRGDLLLVVNEQPKVGDVVIYSRSEQGITIVHRLVSSTNGEYVTKGDNNFASDQPIQKSQILGRVVFAAPLLGYPRFLLFAFGV